MNGLILPVRDRSRKVQTCDKWAEDLPRRLVATSNAEARLQLSSHGHGTVPHKNEDGKYRNFQNDGYTDQNRFLNL